jgi:hypothetical protein
VIVQIRATMGAGKSTLVRHLLREHEAAQVYDGVWLCEGSLYVLGKYNLDGVSPGGGGDKLYGPELVRLMRHYSQYGHVLHEGARAACQFPRGEWLDETLALRERGLVWALLAPPFETCIQRIHQRRVERNRKVGDPLNVKRQQDNYRYVRAYVERGAAAGIRTVTLQDEGVERTYQQLHDLLVFGGWQSGRDAFGWGWSAALAS